MLTFFETVYFFFGGGSLLCHCQLYRHPTENKLTTTVPFFACGHWEQFRNLPVGDEGQARSSSSLRRSGFHFDFFGLFLLFQTVPSPHQQKTKKGKRHLWGRRDVSSMFRERTCYFPPFDRTGPRDKVVSETKCAFDVHRVQQFA